MALGWKTARFLVFKALPVFVLSLLLAVAAASYLQNLRNEAIERPLVVYQENGLADVVNVTVMMNTAPTPDSPSYFGLLVPYLTITFQSSEGNLSNILNHAEVTPTHNSGLDACGSKMFFDDFFISAPTGGATQITSNVTYTSQTLAFPFVDNLPGGDKCVTRFSIEADYDIVVCSERDGTLELPIKQSDGSTSVDTWDICASFKHHGKAGVTSLSQEEPGLVVDAQRKLGTFSPALN